MDGMMKKHRMPRHRRGNPLPLSVVLRLALSAAEGSVEVRSRRVVALFSTRQYAYPRPHPNNTHTPIFHPTPKPHCLNPDFLDFLWPFWGLLEQNGGTLYIPNPAQFTPIMPNQGSDKGKQRQPPHIATSTHYTHPHRNPKNPGWIFFSSRCMNQDLQSL
jgi:hypothetical protein